MNLIVTLPDSIGELAGLTELRELLSISEILVDARCALEYEGETVNESWFKLPKAGSQRQAVLLRLLDGETTRDALHDICDGPRIHELVTGGFAEYTDHKVTTTRGDMARLVQATAKARNACRLQPLSWFPGGRRPEACR